MQIFDLFINNLISPYILFFFLGLFSGLYKSDLSIPESISKYCALYILMSTGFKAGVEICQTSIKDSVMILIFIGGFCFSLLMPFVCYFILNFDKKLNKVNAAAIAASYSCVSLTTFIAGVNFLSLTNATYSTYIIAQMAIMEAPAIVSGLYIAKRILNKQNNQQNSQKKNLLANGAMIMTLGSFVIGFLTGETGFSKMRGFIETPFAGMVVIFMLDAGIQVGKEITKIKEFSISLLLFGIYMPIVNSAIGLLISICVGLDLGTGFLFILLCASSSYIAVPAALKMSLPQANPSVYIPLSLGITFPFNLIVGVPLYYTIYNLLIK